MTDRTPSPPSSGPSAVILGGTGGIGADLTRRLVQSGWRCLVGARDRDRLADIERELAVDTVGMDATKSEEVNQCFQAALDRFGRLDAAVNCVGSILLKPAHLISDAEWQTTLALNLTTAFHTVRSAARAMRSSGGSIVLISSVAARRGLPNHEAIAAAKAGVIGLALASAASYARHRIRVNVVAPGLVRTPLTASLTAVEKTLRYSTSLHPLGRIGEPSDVARAIEWLMSPDQGWMTGQVIGMDGGMGSVQPSLSSAA